MTTTPRPLPYGSAPTINNDARVEFRFLRNGEIETFETDSVETAILTFRREIKRRARADRAERGSFEYRGSFTSWEWIK